MNNRGGLLFAAAIALFALMLRAAPAMALDRFKVQVILSTGILAPKSTPVSFLDSTGLRGTCPASTTGIFLCPSGNWTPPFLVKAGDVYGYWNSPTGFANANGLTYYALNNVLQAMGTSADQLWQASSAPIVIAPVALQAQISATDLQFASVYAANKIKSPYTLKFFAGSLSLKSGLGKALTQLSYTGVGTAQETIQTTLPGNIAFTATGKAIPSTSGSLASWTVQTPRGTTYQSKYSMYSSSPAAPVVYQAVDNFVIDFKTILDRERGLLDSFNLPIYASQFLNNGIDGTTQSWIDATRLRRLRLKSMWTGPIGLLRENFPSTGEDLIGIDIFRSATDHGVPCIDECCYYIVCGSDGSNPLEYGNQRVASFALRAIAESIIGGSQPTTSTYLKSGGRAPQGSVSSYLINDLDGLYHNTNIPKIKTIQDLVQPVHKGPVIPIFFDDYSLQTDFTPPVNPSDRFSISIQPQSGSAQSITAYSPNSTTEQFNLLSQAPANLNDVLGKTFKLKFGSPLGFVVNSQFARAVECTSTQTKMLTPKPAFLSPMARSVSFHTDKSYAGNDIVGAEYDVVQSAIGDGPQLRLHIKLGIGCTF